MQTYAEVLDFWFKELEPKQWFVKDVDLDEEIKKRFAELHEKAARGELQVWRSEPRGRLAEIIVLDQFSRNIFRDSERAFACDRLALQLCKEAVKIGVDQQFSVNEKTFLYMPLMHSEELADHELAVKLFSQPGLEHNLEYELKHKTIIERFGRYPHRNDLLGRESTPDELEFLRQPGSSF